MNTSTRRRLASASAVVLACLLVSGGAAVGQAPAGQAAAVPVEPWPERPRLWTTDRGAIDLGRGSDLDSFILAKMEQAHLPSLSACVLHDDAVVWAKAYGLASIDPEIPATIDTLHLIASNSKPVAATALMKLFEQGLFRLDDPVNDYFPFEVNHPNYEDTPVTFRMLLSHTGAIDDNWGSCLIELITQGDSPIPLEGFLRDYLVPGGLWYDPIRSFRSPYEPGEEYHYSNVGFALGAYAVEPLTDSPFAEHCDTHLFAPLGLSETSWFLDGLDLDHVAMPYDWDGGSGTYMPLGHQGWPPYPSACLRTSVMQQARILMIQMNGGRSLDVPVLKPLTIAQMQSMQAVEPNGGFEYGLGLIRWKDPFGRLWIGHDGSWLGNRTQMHFRPADNVGIILFTNANPLDEGEDTALWEVFGRLGLEFEQMCPADTDDDGDVGFADLLELLGRWGPCEFCREDIDHDGFVGFSDILALLGRWGTCPYIAATGPLGLRSDGLARPHFFEPVPPAGGDVTLSFGAIGDFGDDVEQVEVKLNGTVIGTVFGTGANDCPDEPDTTQIVLSAETFNDLVPDGSAVLKMRASPEADPHQCDGFSYVEARIEYLPVVN